MKIFVSGQIGDAPYVQKVQQKLIDAGHEITHDWTRNETGAKFLGSTKAKLANTTETRRRASADIQGVIDSDAYVICTSNEKVGKGMYVELGAAIALNETTGSPKVYLLGPMEHMTIFYLHPAVKHVESLKDLLRHVAS